LREVRGYSPFHARHVAAERIPATAVMQRKTVMTRGPDMTRSAGDGFTVSARYVPELAFPVLAVVAVKHGAQVIDTLTVPACAGMKVFRHPAVYLPTFRAALLGGESCES
jgi:hypothetical protein